MTVVRDRVQVNIAMQTLFATQRNFRAIGLFDNPLIPTDVRHIVVAGSSAEGYTDVVGSSGVLYDAARTFFDPPQQTPNPLPADLYFGRLILAATSPFWTAGSAETDYSVYKAITDGSIAFNDGTNVDDATGIDFSSVNSLQDLLDVLTTATQAAFVLVTGLDTAEWTLDALGRVTLTNSTTGAAAAEITVEAVDPASGTDLAAAAYLDAANGAAHAGLDAETPLESYSALKDVFSDFWAVTSRGGTDDQILELAQQINGEPRVYLPLEASSTATNPADSTDLNSRGATISRFGASFAYVDEYQEFSMLGGALGAEEGSSAFGFVDRAIPKDSGQAVYNYVLTGPQRTALEAKNYNWVETVGGFKNMYPGRSATGEELRLLLGRDWMQDQMETRIFTARIQRRILGFDAASLAVYEEIITDVLKEALGRNIIQDYVVNIPDADTFSAAEKATHTLTIENAFTAQVVTDAWRYEIGGNLTLNTVTRQAA